MVVVSVAFTSCIANQTLVLAARKECKSNSPMIPRMLIMIPQPIHILAPPRALADAAREGAQAPLGLALDLAQLGFGDLGEVRVGEGEDGGGGEGGRGG